MSSRQASIPRQHTTCAHCALSGRPLIYKSGCQANRLRSSGRPLAAKVLDRNALTDLATPAHPLTLVLPTLPARATADVRRSGPMLQVVPTGSRQCGLERTRPQLVGLGQSPHLVRCQAKLSNNRPERLTCVDGVQELLPHVYREPVLCPRSPVDPSSVVLRLPALRTAASV